MNKFSELNLIALQNLDSIISLIFKDRKVVRLPNEYRVGSRGSLSINLSKPYYYDHEKQVGGDLVDLIMKNLDYDFPNAEKVIRNISGHIKCKPLVVPVVNSISPLKSKKQKITTAHKIWTSSKNKLDVAAAYLATRGIIL